MKQLGQKPKRVNFTDCRPPKGFVNWWEQLAEENKTAEKREARKDIEQQLGENIEY